MVVDLKNMFIIYVLIACVLFSGCMGVDNKEVSEASFVSQTNSESTQVPDFIVKPEDVPGFNLLAYIIYSVPESDSFELSDIPKIEGNLTSHYPFASPKGVCNVGEATIWIDQSERGVSASIYKFDSDLGIDEHFVYVKKIIDGKIPASEVVEFGSCSIGTECYYNRIEQRSGFFTTQLTFFTSNNEMVIVGVTDDKEKSLDEAIRIARIVEGRLAVIDSDLHFNSLI
ncbi:MAG: hypothetical protein Q8J68_08900 [Methanolobus sp.]|nr:hypothetical protein [Methanolobus sp.]